MKNFYLYTTLIFIVFFGLLFSFPIIFKLDKPSKLDILSRKIDCIEILLNAQDRNDIKFTGTNLREIKKQVDLFQNDCVNYTLLKETK